MRIGETDNASKPGSVKKKKTSGSAAAGGFSAIFDTVESEEQPIQEVPVLGNIQSVLSLDTLGILANAGNEEYIKKENIDWGNGVLDQLNSIKYQILNGKIAYSSLSDLKEKLNNIPLNAQDSKLKQIIQEIEIRAAVELEKLKKISEQAKIFVEV